jgi:uncharacterized repeat protein (TIGR03803 family)
MWCDIQDHSVTVYRVNSTDADRVLHRFGTAKNDGRFSNGGLVERAGTLYGTTYLGGILTNCHGRGTVFRIAGNGTYMVLHRFTGAADGSSPGDLVEDTAGNLYRGAGGGSLGFGVVFKITP